MPTIVQTVVRNVAIGSLIVLCSAYACIELLIHYWYYYYTLLSAHGIFGRLRQVFFNKTHCRPTALDSNLEWSHHFIQLSEIRMHYVASGDASRPLMICLHGFPEFWYSFRYQLRYFARNHRVVALDLRGYNETDKPEGVDNYDVEILAKDVAEVIEKLGSPAIVIGHDWGGVVAWILAMHRPELIADRLIVLNAPHPKAGLKIMRTRSAQLRKSWYMFMFQCPMLGEFYIRAMDYAFIEKMFCGDGVGIVNRVNFNDEDLEAWKYVFSQPGAITPTLNVCRAAMRVAGRRHFSSEPIRPKTLIVWGECDGLLEFHGAQLSVKLCRDACIKIVPGSSHWTQQDAPDAVNKIIENFLRDNFEN